MPTVRGPDGAARDLLAEERATANAIYGIIVSSAVMASAHEQSVVALAVAVLVTLVIYWAAERFAHVMGQRIVHTPELTAGQLRRHLGTGWELVSASFLPLGVLLGSGAAGRRRGPRRAGRARSAPRRSSSRPGGGSDGKPRSARRPGCCRRCAPAPSVRP